MPAILANRFVRPALAMLPPLVAWGAQTLLWAQMKPMVWIFFYPAVFFSSLIGGLWCGLAATAISTAVVWQFFIVPGLGVDVRFEIPAGVFLAMGVLFSVFNERLRVANENLEKRVQQRTEDLESAVTTLQQRKAELKMVTDTAHVGLVIVDAQHRYRFRNRTYCELLKLPTFELVGRSVADLLPGVYATQIRPRLERAFSGEAVEYLLHMPSADGAGSSRHFSVSYAPVMDGAERVVVVAIADVTARKRSDEVAAQLAAIVESSSDAIIGKDLEGIVTSWNAGAEAVFGFTADQMVGQPIGRLIPAARSDEERTILESIRRGEPVRHFETQRQHADGRLLDVSITVSSIRDSEGKVVGASKVARDVTEAKRVQRALAESEERLRLAIDAAQLGTWESNYRTGGLRWSERQEEMMGFAPGTFPGTLEAFRMLVHPADLGRLGEAQRRAFEPGGSYHAELRFVLRDGRVRWGLLRGRLLRGADGKPERMLGIEMDVTERRLAEEALRESEARYRALVSDLPAGVFRKDREGRFEFVSERFCAMEGLPAEHFFGRTVTEVADQLAASGRHLAHDWRATMRQTYRGADHHRTIMETGTTIEVEEEWISTTGVRRFFQAVKTPVFGADGSITGSQGVVFEITDRKLAEEAVRQLNTELEQRVIERTAQLEAANKELEAFSYTVSHDLRAPLRAINGFSLAVQEDYGAQLPEEGQRFLQNVRAGALRMGSLIDDLLTFSRLSRLPLTRQTVDSVAIVKDALAELGWPLTGRKIELEIGALPPSDADPVLLKQVWVNLLSNALKYTRKREQARVEVGCRLEGGELVFFVRDNGSGFDPRFAHKLFGVFQRLHRAEDYEGTGVGLAIVQRVVHRHGGRVWAETELEVGSSFFFTLKSAQSV